jgi:hypothetical protein
VKVNRTIGGAVQTGLSIQTAPSNLVNAPAPSSDNDRWLVSRAFEHSTSHPALDGCHDLGLWRHHRVLNLVTMIDDDEARLDRKWGTRNEDHRCACAIGVDLVRSSSWRIAIGRANLSVRAADLSERSLTVVRAKTSADK